MRFDVLNQEQVAGAGYPAELVNALLDAQGDYARACAMADLRKHRREMEGLSRDDALALPDGTWLTNDTGLYAVLGGCLYYRNGPGRLVRVRRSAATRFRITEAPND